MSDEQKYTIQGLDEYIRQGEPQKRERSEAWKVAPKCKIERRTASKVQKLHFRRGSGASHHACEPHSHSKGNCHCYRKVRTNR